MPQMMPMSWMALYIMFSVIFIMFNMSNYFTYIPINHYKSKMSTKSIKKNWKW
uniref:ATP synthase F0 subunit 8 n=1 Tax=Balta dissecta TaxID=3037035 RepID=UPI0027A3CE77|nr:ATP synthase F0 subunit 8 [Balta dissecta]WGO57148.1 ATP synthase F0 subunit 8 [Balta dissecta]